MFINFNFTSPNFSERILPIEYVVLHYTEMNFDDALAKLLCAEAEVSAHYLIKKNGEIFQLVGEDKIAWHAGKSCWHNLEKLNQNSIGIELDNLGNEAFPNSQIDSCLKLCAYLKAKYKIPTPNFIGHSDIAPSRKIDPGIFFDWQLFAKHGFGIWHNYKTEDLKELYSLNEKGSHVELLQQKLQLLGYEIKITGIFDFQTNFVVRAFQAKFLPHILHKKGLDYYRNLSSIYTWCSSCDACLNKLITYSLN
ncbi:MAG: N-acetylmuramoyl-L-alanine amidase [Rickettsiales bacterium]|nr:MAG: N-acetylmuramoyl-L-alanine amidase [Rickettsiales bacterium]